MKLTILFILKLTLYHTNSEYKWIFKIGFYDDSFNIARINRFKKYKQILT